MKLIYKIIMINKVLGITGCHQRSIGRYMYRISMQFYGSNRWWA